MTALMRFFVDRSLLINMVSVLILAMGAYAAFTIHREAFPNVNMDFIMVSAVYPGATPEEIERLVMIPLEQELKAVDGVNKMQSTAFPGSLSVGLEVDPHHENRSRLVSDVQLAVSRAKLPKDLPAQPVVTEISGKEFPIINLAISAPRTDLEVKRLGDRLEDDILQIPGIARVVIQGPRKAELRIELEPEKLDRYRISVAQVIALLQNWNVNAPGGEVSTPTGQKVVRIVGEFTDTKDVANLVLRATESGAAVRLGDVARISETLEEPNTLYTAAGIKAINMIVMKKSDADIIKTIDKIRAYLDTIPKRYGEDLKITAFQDFSKVAKMRLGVLTTNGAIGLILVFVSLLLFLRPSVALTTTWGLPIVFFSGLYVIYAMGITLNLISMLGFIMVLGLMVDDAIIVGENITYHMEKGLSPRDAAIKGSVELFGPVTATVMTTIIAFLPMMFMSGIIGKFIYAIPIVVSLLLFFSWLESFLVLPNHVALVTNPHKHPPERAWLRGLEHFYAWMLDKALTWRWLTVLATLALLIGSFVLAGTQMKFQLFASAGMDQFIVRVTAPPGTRLTDMREHLLKIDTAIRERIDTTHLETTLATSGQISTDSNDPLTRRGDRFGQIRVIFTPFTERPDSDAMEIMVAMAKEIPPLFPNLEIAFTPIRPGPPTGRAMELEISGDNYEAIERVARRAIGYLEKTEGVTTIESGLQPGDSELHVILDRSLAAYAGVSLSSAASHVRAAVGGLPVTSLRRGSEEVDVTIRFPKDGKNELDVLKKLYIANDRGRLVPLEKIARLEENPGFSTIRHKDGFRVMSVNADVDDIKITSAELNARVAKDKELWLGDDAGQVRIGYGGEAEKRTESVIGLLFSFAFAIIGIFVILAIQFNNITYPLLVMLSIPFGAIGIIISFYFHDLFWKPMPLSFFALMGMVALSGVVVNSALVLLVFVQRAIKDGMHWRDAVLLAGQRRLRAVLLTATTTIVGLLPTAYGWGGADPFVAPLALALSWGLIFSTGITLLTIPATLAVGMDLKHFKQKIWAMLRPKRRH